MTPTTQRDALAADLLADLATESELPDGPATGPAAGRPVVPGAPRKRSRTPRPSPGPASTPGPHSTVGPASDSFADPIDPRGRGPALRTVLQFQPLDWYRPLLALERRSLAVRVGPVYAKVSLGRR